ncbi:uncharacterized protein TNCV_362321 [Trichonephila clavipes]|nr:uncharacterized protein TNCV_362321 [Trichonephila clavipes]
MLSLITLTGACILTECGRRLLVNLKFSFGLRSIGAAPHRWKPIAAGNFDAQFPLQREALDPYRCETKLKNLILSRPHKPNRRMLKSTCPLPVFRVLTSSPTLFCLPWKAPDCPGSSWTVKEKGGEKEKLNEWINETSSVNLPNKREIILFFLADSLCQQRSRRAASPLVRLVEGEERWEAFDHPQIVLALNWGGTEPNCTVTCMVHKATPNSRCHLALCHDEFRRPRSGHCRSVLSETCLGNESDIFIPNFNCIVKNKRPNTRAGGVAIYQNSSYAVNIITPSMECSVSQSDIYGTIQSSVRDLCLAECVIDNGEKIIIVAVYITPNKKLDDIIEFLHRSLLPYTSRGSALLNKNYDKIPMILSVDFNVNFALDKSLQLIEFLKENFTLSLQNNRTISTTKSNTTIDAVFARYLSDIECKTYISYFSYLKPFITKKSSVRDKFHYLVLQLEPKYVENIWDIVNSKSDTKYTDSKNRLLSLFKESENLRIKRLLTGIELGDMKPSQLLQKLKTVATSDISDNLIKTLWLEKLPESIKNILVVSEENLSKLAVMADKISDMTPRTDIFATGKSLDCGEATSSRDQLLLDRIQSLEEQICQLSILHKSRTKERNSFRPKSRSRSRKRFDPKGKYCYFHFRFGARCKPEKCSPPCAWNRNTENFSLQ